MSKAREFEDATAKHLDNSRHVPNEDPEMPYPETLALMETKVSENLEEIRARAKEEGIDEAEAIAQRQAEYEATDVETEKFAKRRLVRGVTPITNLQTSPSAALRSLTTRLFGGGLASNANIQGRVGNSISAPVEARINASNRYVDSVLHIMNQYRQDYYGSLPKAMAKGFKGDLDKHTARIMRSNGEEVADATAPTGMRPLEEWEKKLYKDLNDNAAKQEDYRYRQGYHDDLIRRQGWDEESLDLARKRVLEEHEAKVAKAWKFDRVNDDTDLKVQRLEAERDRDLALIDELKPLAQRAAAGDRNAAYKMVRALTGDKNYVPQAWSITKLRAIGEDEFVQRALVSTKSKLARLADDIEALPSLRAIHKARLDNWNEGAEKANLSAAYKNLVEKEMGAGDLDGALLDGTVAKTPSSLQGRQIMIEQDDVMMGELLEQSYAGVMFKNQMQVAPYLELKKAGVLPGSQSYKNMLKQVRDELDVRTHGLDAKTAEKLRKRVEKDLEAFEYQMKVMIHQHIDQSSRKWRSTAAALKDLQVTRSLGSVIFMNLTDVAIGSMKMGGIAAYARNSRRTFRRVADQMKHLSKEDAATLANVNDIAAATTMHKISDNVDDGVERGAFSAAMGKMTDSFMKLTGLPYLNQFNKVASVLLTEDRLIQLARGTRKVIKEDKVWLAQHGWDEAKLARVADLFERYGDTHGTGKGKVHFFEVARLREDYELELSGGGTSNLASDMNLLDEFGAFANLLMDRNVVSPGKGDLPKFISKDPTMQLMFQFKSFAFASVDKTLNPLIQNLSYGNYRVLEGVFSGWAMATVGWYAYMASRGRLEEANEKSPQQIAYEALMRSGLLPLLDLGITSTQKLTANFGGLGDYVGLAPVSRYYSRNAVTEFLGPTVGWATEAYGALGNTFWKAREGEALSHQDWSKIARLAPYNNLFYLRAALEYGLRD